MFARMEERGGQNGVSLRFQDGGLTWHTAETGTTLKPSPAAGSMIADPDLRAGSAGLPGQETGALQVEADRTVGMTESEGDNGFSM